MLDDRYKNALYLVKIEELTYQETAEILGESIQNVKNLIHRGKKELRKNLIKKGFDEMNKVAKVVMEWLGVTNATQTIYRIFIIVKWPIAIIMIYLAIKLIYVIAPDWHILSKNTTKGAVFTTVGWTIATAIFSYYISHFANYDIFYGSLSSIVILMIWVYFLSYILVVGIAINVKQYKDRED